MATTPNYTWPTPDDTDNVADGAAAIRALGDAIDTDVDSIQGIVDGAVLPLRIRTITITDSFQSSGSGFTDSPQSLGFPPKVVGSTLIVRAVVPVNAGTDSVGTIVSTGGNVLLRESNTTVNRASFGHTSPEVSGSLAVAYGLDGTVVLEHIREITSLDDLVFLIRLETGGDRRLTAGTGDRNVTLTAIEYQGKEAFQVQP